MPDWSLVLHPFGLPFPADVGASPKGPAGGPPAADTERERERGMRAPVRLPSRRSQLPQIHTAKDSTLNDTDDQEELDVDLEPADDLQVDDDYRLEILGAGLWPETPDWPDETA